MNKSIKISICIFILLVGFLFFFQVTEKPIEVSEADYKIINGQYSVSFVVENKSRKQLDTKLSVKLLNRNFVGGSPKAEVLEIVGEKVVPVHLSASESKRFEETIKPKTFAFKVDKININILEY